LSLSFLSFLSSFLSFSADPDFFFLSLSDYKNYKLNKLNNTLESDLSLDLSVLSLDLDFDLSLEDIFAKGYLNYLLLNKYMFIC